jgi:predicted NBD/HSP70 family sugar kinase
MIPEANHAGHAGPDDCRVWGTATLKTHNAQMLVGTLLNNPEGLTQEDLRNQTQLAQGTVSRLVGALNEVVMADRDLGGGRSRKPKRFSVKGDAMYVIGLSIGLRRVVVTMLNAFGEPVNKHAESAAILDTLADRCHTMDTAVSLIKNVVGTPKRCRKLAALTVSLPGPVVNSPPDLPDATIWVREIIRAEIARRWAEEGFSMPPTIMIERNANTAARGEMLCGAGAPPGVHSLLYVHWSVTVTAALVLDDLIWRGVRDRAGDLGHVKVLVDERQRRALRLGATWSRCSRCGQIDCVDVRANSAALAAGAHAPEPENLLARARTGDQKALAALRAGGRLVGRAVGPMLTMLDVDKVVLGGRIGREAFDLVSQEIKAGVLEAAELQRRDPTPIEQTKLGGDATALGGALWALDRTGARFLARSIQ